MEDKILKNKRGISDIIIKGKMKAPITLEVKNEKVSFIINRTKSDKELEDIMILISALRLMIKYYEEMIIKKFGGTIEE